MSLRVRQLAAGVALVAVLFATGSQWVVLQSVAWASMFVRYAQVEDLGTALEQTFDGQHPCKLCHRVQQGQRAEKKGSPLTDAARRPDCLLTVEVVRPPGCTPVRETVPYLNPFFLEVGSSPVKPIPRG
jgi:hypothetical protein